MASSAPDRPAVLNVLSTVPATTSWEQRLGGKTTHHKLSFLDFAVDEVPLRQLAIARDPASHAAREMTRLCHDWPWPLDAVAGLTRLLAGEATADFDDGRVALLVCPVCADLGCHALSARVVVQQDTVSWQELGWESSYEPFAAARPDRDGVDPPPTFWFDRKAYVALLEGLLTEFEQAASTQTSRHTAMRRWRRRQRE